MLLPAGHEQVRRVEELAAEGLRVLLLAAATTMPDAGELPDDLTAIALVVFTDEVRPDAADTVDYFMRENVRPKVISGDNPVTVAAIARRCNVPTPTATSMPAISRTNRPRSPRSPTPRPCSGG